MKKKKHLILVALLLISSLFVALIGCFIKFAILEPLGIQREESVMALPFVVLTDEGLRFMIEMSAQPTEPPAPSTQPPTTVPVETTVPPETVPPTTVPEETTVPTEPPVVILDESWFDDALFIGDSRTVGLQTYARLGNADYFCDVGMNVFNVRTSYVKDYNFSETTLQKLLEKKTYGKILICLGLNEAGYPYDNVMAGYKQLIDLVREKQPEAVIILQSVMTVTEKKANSGKIFTLENLAKINEGILGFVDGEMIQHIDVNAWIADENGYLPGDLSFDGVHLIADGYANWSQWFRESCANIIIPNKTETAS